MRITNQEISRRLREAANDLAHTGGNLYRIRAFRQAAITVLALPDDVSTIVASSGQEGLERVPGIGKSLAETIANYVQVDERIQSLSV